MGEGGLVLNGDSGGEYFWSRRVSRGNTLNEWHCDFRGDSFWRIDMMKLLKLSVESSFGQIERAVFKILSVERRWWDG